MTIQEIISRIKAEVERLMDEYKPTIGGIDETTGAHIALAKLHTFLSDLEKEEKPIEGFDGEFSKFSNDVDAEHPFPICVDEYKDFARHFYELGRQSKKKELLPMIEQPVKTNIVEDLKHYLATTPKEQIEKDWESLKEWGKVGPSVSEFLGWEQPVCEGLEEEAESCWRIVFPDGGIETTKMALTHDEFMMCARHFAQWQKEKDERTLRKFFNDRNQGDASFYDLLAYREGHRDGMDEQKEQMMKEAVEGEVFNAHLHNEGDVFVQSDYLSKEQFKPGERVKMIIIKGD